MSESGTYRRLLLGGLLSVLAGCSGGTGDEADVECAAGQTECGGICTVLQADPRNCGGCGTHCESGLVCLNGACSSSCGNGSRTGVEACDDGDTDSGDGCSEHCTIELGWSCIGTLSSCSTTCGDGIVAGNEVCDDGNKIPNDGCSPLCLPEKGFGCTGSPSTCTTTCGDGTIAGSEACDDGHVLPGDGCNERCEIETGFSCSGEPSACAAICGDGLIVEPESCDDENTTAMDGCSEACMVEPGFECSGTPSVCESTCGDGLMAGQETCDDGNLSPGDGCSEVCTVEQGFLCNGVPSKCLGNCGDGLIRGAEACDDGNVFGTDGCSQTCQVEPGFSCAGVPSACIPLCGDGLVAGTEECDDGALAPGDGCNGSCVAESGFSCLGTPSVCTPVMTCGPGSTLNTFTSTDVPRPIGWLQPTITSTLVVSGTSAIVTQAAVEISFAHTWVEDLGLWLIGPNNKGVLLSREVGGGADDHVGTVFVDAAPISIVAGTAPFSGPHAPMQSLSAYDGLFADGTWTLGAQDFVPLQEDGTLTRYRLHLCLCSTCESGAACGDNLDNDGDGLTDCADPHCAQFASCAVCGNGVVQPGEGCDDGNLTGGDGCSSTCEAEPFQSCTGSPSACTTAVSCPTGTSWRTFSATDLPRAVHDVAGYIQSDIAVTGTGTIAAAHVQIDLPHEKVGELDVMLTDPIGSTVFLSHLNGGSGTGYLGTIFDDAAPMPISSGTAPFAGSWQPEDALSLLNGLSVAGTWSLWVADLDTSANDGTLRTFNLSLCVVP